MNIHSKYPTAYILAGGKSSRMGADKGLLLLKDKPIIQFVIEQLLPVVKNIVIVSNNPLYKKFGLELIPDLVPDIGPAGGIHAALQHSRSTQNFIISCDMPFIHSNAIQYMISCAEGVQITLPVYKEKVQPLFGVYSTDCLAKWEQFVAQGMIKLQTIVEQFDLRKMNVDDNDLFNDLVFTNINDRNDFENAVKQWHHGS